MSRFCTQLRYFSRRCDQEKIVVWSPHYHAPITFQRKKFLSTKWLEKKKPVCKKIEIVFFFEGVCKISLNKIGKLFTATLSIAKKLEHLCMFGKRAEQQRKLAGENIGVEVCFQNKQLHCKEKGYIYRPHVEGCLPANYSSAL